MRLIRRGLLAAFAVLLLTLPLAAANLKNEIYLYTKDGKVTILLRPDLAPKTVAQIEALTRRGFFNGLKFHRVIDGFMAQTGDPTATGTGGSDLPNVPAEFNKAQFKRGSLGLARLDDPDSGNSQFFICFADSGFLDGQYTNFGEVIDGMDVIDKIKKGSQADNGTVTDPDKIVKMEMATDAK